MIAALAALVSGRGAQGQTEPLYYIYHGAPKALTLDTERIAVQIGTGSSRRAKESELSPGLIRLGFTTAHVTARPLPGWIILDTQNIAIVPNFRHQSFARASAAAVHALIESLLSSDDANIRFVSPVFEDSVGNLIVITPRLLIGFKENFSETARNQLRDAVPEGVAPEAMKYPQPNEQRWQIKTRDGFVMLARANVLAQTFGVAYAEPDLIATGKQAFIPSDPGFGQSWGLKNTGQLGGRAGFDIEATSAWDITLGSPSVIVLVIDTGVQQDHPDLNLVTGRDFTTDASANPNGGPFGPYDNHGTYVAGCISERINNALGSAGVAPGVKVASARCYNNGQPNGNYSFQFSWVADALYWGQSIGTRISNNSSGYGATSSAIENAYDTTHAHGMIHFASAGNNGNASISYPASIPSVNAVGAANRFGERSFFSQYGNGLKFLAPGQDIFTTHRIRADAKNNCSSVSGTSFASPYAAAVAALILSRNPKFTPAQVEARMQATCTDMGPAGYETGYGYGLVDAFRALTGNNLANLAPYQPTGWPGKLVISNAAHRHSANSRLQASDTLYVNFASRNNGNGSATAQFSMEIYVDGVLRKTFSHTPPLTSNSSTMIEDYCLGSLSMGRHTIWLKVDPEDAIAESDETDNECSTTVTIGDATPIPIATEIQQPQHVSTPAAIPSPLLTR